MPPKPQPKAAGAQAKATSTAAKATTIAKTTNAATAKGDPNDLIKCRNFLTPFWQPRSLRIPNEKLLPTVLASDENVQLLLLSLKQPLLQENVAWLVSNAFQVKSLFDPRPILYPEFVRLFKSGLLSELMHLFQPLQTSRSEKFIVPLLCILDNLFYLTQPTMYYNQFIDIVSADNVIDPLFWWFKNGEAPLKHEIIRMLNWAFELPTFDSFIARGFFDYAYYSQPLAFVHSYPMSTGNMKYNALRTLLQGMNRNTCKDYLKWIPMLMTIIEKSRDDDIVGISLRIISVVHHVMTRNGVNDAPWRKAVMGNDKGKRILTLCCRPDRNGLVMQNSLLCLDILLNFNEAKVSSPPQEIRDIFEMAWKCGLERFYLTMAKSVHKLPQIDNTDENSTHGFHMITTLFFRHLTLPYLEKYPEFLNKVAVSVLDHSRNVKSHELERHLNALATGTLYRSDPKWLVLLFQSPIIDRLYKILMEDTKSLVAQFQIMQMGKVPPTTLQFGDFQATIELLNICVGRCLDDELAYPKELQSELVEMMLNWATNPVVTGALNIVGNILPIFHQFPNPQAVKPAKFLPSFSRTTDLMTPIRTSLTLLSYIIELTPTPSNPFKGDEEAKWKKFCSEFDSLPQFQAPLLRILPEFKIKLEASRAAAAGGAGSTPSSTTTSTSSTTTTKPTPTTTTTTNGPESTTTQQSQPETKPTPTTTPTTTQKPQPQIPQVKSQQEKVEARRAKMEAAKKKKEVNNDPDGMD